MKKATFLTLATLTLTVLLLIISVNYPKLTANAQADTNTQLTITGLVEHSLNLSLNQIIAYPTTSINAAIICVDVPNFVIEQGTWTGVKLGTLLEEAGISAGAIKVGLYASDGYSTDLTIQTAMRGDVILSYQKDNQPLSGLRLVVPGKWGYKWINQVTSITLVDYDFLGHWESQGYSDEATITSNAHIPVQIQQNPPANPNTSSPLSPTPTPKNSLLPNQQSSSSAIPLQSTPAPASENSESHFTQTELIYAIAASIGIALVIFLVAARKKTKR
jgi:hypothetical protein